MQRELGHSRLSYRGQIVIPKKVKDMLNARDGEYIIFYEDNNGRVFIKPGVLKPLE